MANPITQTDGGKSLASIYDTVGQQFGGPQAEIEADRILLVHEMGQTLLSERLVIRHRQIVSAAIPIDAATDFDVTISDLPLSVSRILSVVVRVVGSGAVVAADINNVGVFVQNPIDSREHPIWLWRGGALDSFRMDFGAGPVNTTLLSPTAVQVAAYVISPTLVTSPQANQASGRQLVMRGRTNAVGGAGLTATFTASVALAFPIGTGQPQAQGLPIPSW